MSCLITSLQALQAISWDGLRRQTCLAAGMGSTPPALAVQLPQPIHSITCAAVCHADLAADLAAFASVCVAVRLEELNEKRQSMVSKLKGVEKELTGGCSCATCQQQQQTYPTPVAATSSVAHVIWPTAHSACSAVFNKKFHQGHRASEAMHYLHWTCCQPVAATSSVAHGIWPICHWTCSAVVRGTQRQGTGWRERRGCNILALVLLSFSMARSAQGAGWRGSRGYTTLSRLLCSCSIARSGSQCLHICWSGSQCLHIC